MALVLVSDGSDYVVANGYLDEVSRMSFASVGNSLEHLLPDFNGGNRALIGFQTI
jgi:hypothetical protein